MKLPGETLSQYVRRRMAGEGRMTAKQEREAFIDGNKLLKGSAVVMALGGGKGERAGLRGRWQAAYADHRSNQRRSGFGLRHRCRQQCVSQHQVQPPHSGRVPKRKIR